MHPRRVLVPCVDRRTYTCLLSREGLIIIAHPIRWLIIFETPCSSYFQKSARMRDFGAYPEMCGLGIYTGAF